MLRERAAKPWGAEEKRDLLSLLRPRFRVSSRTLLSRPFFHDIPQMESLLAGYKIK